ncbi:MAG: nucleotide exchange factor GrpE [Methanobacteriota archaeon]|nr:MAG: nucleotide exchange factor GrpE [Euryarchaeota archaeon]
MTDDSEDSLSSKEGEEASKGQRRAGSGDNEMLAARDARIEELEDTVKRTQAEFENYKKRIEREWAERTRMAGERVIIEMLPVLDTLDKAVEGARGGSESESQEAGLEGIRRQLVQTLQRAGLKEIRTDVPFDPFVHEALMREEANGDDAGKILEVFQKGYTLGPKVLRAARVKVSVEVAARTANGDEGGSTQHDDQETDNQDGGE